LQSTKEGGNAEWSPASDVDSCNNSEQRDRWYSHEFYVILIAIFRRFWKEKNSVARDTEQLNPRCSMQSCHHQNQSHKAFTLIPAIPTTHAPETGAE